MPEQSVPSDVAGDTLVNPPRVYSMPAGDPAHGGAGEASRQEAPSDASLVRSVQCGESDSFGHIWERYYRSIYKFVYYKTGDRELADDLTQIAFLRAFDALPQFTFRPDVPFSAWLFAIAHNLVVDHYRKQSSRPAALSIEERLIGGTLVDPEDEAERADRLADVDRVFGYLTHEQQTVLQLKFLQGLNNREVADIMGKNEGAVKTLQHRALASLARLLGTTRASLQPGGKDARRPQRQAKLNPETYYNFAIALFREETHPVLTELVDPDQDFAKTFERDRIFREIMVPVLDSRSMRAREIAYRLFFEGENISEIQYAMGGEVDVSLILREVRNTLLSLVENEPHYEPEAVKEIFAGTRAFYLLFEPWGRMRAVRYYKEEGPKRSREKPEYSFLLKLSLQALERLYGQAQDGGVTGGGASRESPTERLERLMPTLQSVVFFYVPAGVTLEPFNGSWLIVHKGRVVANSSEMVTAGGGDCCCQWISLA